MDIITPAELAQFRADALDRMESRAVVRRRTAKTPQNEATGLESPVWLVIHTDEPLRYVTGGATAAGASRAATPGGVQFQEGTGRADFRWNLTDLRDGDHIEITAGEWAGTVLKVVEAVKGDQRTARRVPVAEVSRPSEWEA